MSEKEFLEIVEAACERPKLYTPTGAFYEVASFLDGYGLGKNLGGHVHHHALIPFLKWIVKKFAIQKTLIDLVEFREMFSSDSDALKNLSILYKEYVGSI